MANHPSDHDGAAGGPDEGVPRSPGDQAQHASPPGWGTEGRAPDGGGPAAAATAEIPAPGGWQGRASGLPEHGGYATTATWSGGWPAYGGPAAQPAQGSWYAMPSPEP